jgi:hypothetical protein
MNREYNIGAVLITDNGCEYIGEITMNGICYKDMTAWHSNNGVIYIGEYDLDDYSKGNISQKDLWTREMWLNSVIDHIKRLYDEESEEMTNNSKFIENIAYDVLINADWQDLSTLLDDYENNGDWILTNWKDYKEKNMNS